MKEILCFGDSNTHGYMPGLGTRYPIDQRWSGLLGKLLGDGYHVVEEGMDGRTTAFEDDLQPWRSALGYIGPCVKTHAPLDLIIIMLGTNDSKTRYGVSAEEIGFGMQELIQRIETFFRYNAGRAGACPKILIISPVPMPQTGGDPELNAESLQKQAGLAAVYKAVAEQYGCAFAAAEDWITPEQLGVDFCHFTPEAHRIFAEKTAELVHQLLD